jgi:hypothetical protein
MESHLVEFTVKTYTTVLNPAKHSSIRRSPFHE